MAEHEVTGVDPAVPGADRTVVSVFEQSDGTPALRYVDEVAPFDWETMAPLLAEIAARGRELADSSRANAVASRECATAFRDYVKTSRWRESRRARAARALRRMCRTRPSRGLRKHVRRMKAEHRRRG